MDIKSLTTLLLATPKTDVVQAVGRILRQKGHQPVVLDIIDAHEPFRSQWKKRQAFYKKEGYDIQTTDNNRYMQGEWDKKLQTSAAASTPKPKTGKTATGKDEVCSTITVDTTQEEAPRRKCLIKLKSQ